MERAPGHLLFCNHPPVRGESIRRNLSTSPARSKFCYCPFRRVSMVGSVPNRTDLRVPGVLTHVSVPNGEYQGSMDGPPSSDTTIHPRQPIRSSTTRTGLSYYHGTFRSTVVPPDDVQEHDTDLTRVTSGHGDPCLKNRCPRTPTKTGPEGTERNRTVSSRVTLPTGDED